MSLVCYRSCGQRVLLLQRTMRDGELPDGVQGGALRLPLRDDSDHQEGRQDRVRWSVVP